MSTSILPIPACRTGPTAASRSFTKKFLVDTQRTGLIPACATLKIFSMHRKVSTTVAWFLFAGFVICAVAWHAQIGVATQDAERQHFLLSPAKTKATDRQAESTFSGNPHKLFLARCKAGLTDQEIGWIVEDFENAGLDRDYPADMSQAGFLAFRQAQDRWYRELLGEALQYSSDQLRQVAKQLTANYEKEKELYQNRLGEIKPFEIDGKFYKIAGADVTNSIYWSSQWKSENQEELLPWKLCTLTPQQESIVRKASPTAQSEGIQTESERRLTGNGEGRFVIPAFGDVDAIIPLTANALSKLDGPSSAPNILSALHHIHPAQLKLLLLFDQDMSAQIRGALDSNSSSSPAK